MQQLIVAVFACMLWAGGFYWLAVSDQGNRYTQAQRLNIGNCWPVCEPLKEGQYVSYTIVTKEGE